MSPHQLIAKWKRAALSERSACQQHFLDLCDLLEQPKPAEADPEGTWYTFERGVRKTDGGQGYADVWYRGRFAWEYKRKRKDLGEAYRQLLLYRESLENPPLLVVCDLVRFEVHTNFTGTPKAVYAFPLEGLAEPAHLDVLRKVFVDPFALKPGQTTDAITQDAADRFGALADGMRARGVPAEKASRFLTKLIFCMFAEDIGLLPERLFQRTVRGAKGDPHKLSPRLQALFRAMSKGGDFGTDEVDYFNGGLFADAEVVDLTSGEMDELSRVNEFDWSHVEPSIFGTLFERTLDPSKRSQIGAHYTSRQDIERLLEPVMMAPLRREWNAVKAECDTLLPGIRAAAKASEGRRARKDSKARRQFDRLLTDFAHRLSQATVLDPACGSGNFLYVALHLLLHLEKEVIAYGQSHGIGLLPHVKPTQLAGIEINRYAQQLAQIVIWIGYLQWMHENGFSPPRHPVLEPIDSIQCRDAIVDLTTPTLPVEPEWPAAEFIVGNPPFLGGKRLLSQVGERYTGAVRRVWDNRLPHFSDLCCYWFEKARAQIENKRTRRAGLLATQGIRGGANREVLKRIKRSGDIFWAESDRNWVLDGANVHVSMIGFDEGAEIGRSLDGKTVPSINANLTSVADVTTAVSLPANHDRAFIGVQKSGPFELPIHDAVGLARMPALSKRPNSDVLRIYWTAVDMVRRPLDVWIVDFRLMAETEAARFEEPFERLRAAVPTERTATHFRGYPNWQLWRPREEMHRAIGPLSRFLVTPHVSKHRIFTWAEACVCPSNLLIAIATESDCDFGILQSRVHETWALALGTQLREKESGFRYTATTCFETFPFPTASAEQSERIAAAAKELDELRRVWLNPPEWTREDVIEFSGSTDGPWGRYVRDADERGVGTVRYSRLVPKHEDFVKPLSKRTLTSLYNERPTWLELAHKKLDGAVLAAYGWDPGLSHDQLLGALLSLNSQYATA